MTGKTPGGESHRPHSSRTRRQVLAGVAAATSAAVAGCQHLPGFSDESTTRYTPAEADTVLESDGPTLEWPVPVEPNADTLEDALERADTLVDEIPEPLEESHVPNGVIRGTIDENRTEAMAARDEAANATGPAQYHALRDARELHETAREAGTAWLAIDADRDELLGELRDEYDAVGETVADQLAAIGYRGDDTDEGRRRAALYYYQYESDLERADRTVDRWDIHEGDDVLALGESAGELEFATTTADIWEHFDEQYAADVSSDDDGDLEAVFEDTLERSIERADAADFPELDGSGDEEEWLVAVGLEGIDGLDQNQGLRLDVWNAGRAVTDSHEAIEEALSAGTLGTGLYRALEFEHSLRGFERFRDRIADGDLERPDEIDVIRTERAAALEAAATACDELSSAEPSLGAYRLAETLRSLSWADRAVARAADNDPETNVSLGGEYRDYALVRAQLEALPEAVEAFRDRLLER